MNDQPNDGATNGATNGATDGANDGLTVPSGNRWEPTDGAPVLPPDPPARTGPAPNPRSRRDRRSRLAGGAAAIVLAAGLGGFALGQATTPTEPGGGVGGPGVGGFDGPGVVQQDDHHGLPGDHRFDGGSGGAGDGGGNLSQQVPGTGGEGSNT